MERRRSGFLRIHADYFWEMGIEFPLCLGVRWGGLWFKTFETQIPPPAERAPIFSQAGMIPMNINIFSLFIICRF
ncbi:MAG: hypothetical protein L6Q59_14965 [Ignavibacteriaceae bacterium]|nr:hypothetical protein [Ignavibacteriaceae bacterium]